MKKLLLTGFGPFLKNDLNPTQDIIHNLHGQTIGDYKIYGEILPVEFNVSRDILFNLIEDIRPDAIINLGLAQGRVNITPERVAINCNDGSAADNAGYKPKGEKIFKDGVDGLFSTLPIKEMVNAMNKNNIPARISNSAGTYVCNHVMYSALYYIKSNNLTIPTGFIHVPSTIKNPSQKLSLEELIIAIELCIQQL